MAVVVVIVAVVIVVVADVFRRVLVVRRGETHDVAEILRPFVVDGGAVEDFGFGGHVCLHHGIQSVAVQRSGNEEGFMRGVAVVFAVLRETEVPSVDGDELGSVLGNVEADLALREQRHVVTEDERVHGK